MKKLFLLAAAVFCLSNAPAFASVPEGSAISPAVLAPLGAWVSQAMHTKLAFLPLATASGWQLKTSIGLEGVQQARSIAAYLPGRIIVNNVTWDEESVRMQSYLVHELVHHAQLMSRRTYPCAQAKEREAYTLQNQWLVEHGESPIYGQSWIDAMSRCRDS